MLHPTFSRRFLWLGLLRGSLIVGAVYDLGFALLMVFAPGATAERISLPLPGEKFYVWLLATLLGMLALLYVAAARDPRRYSAIIAVAIAGRLAGATLFAIAASGRPELGALWPLSGIDLLFGLTHAVAWAPLRA